MALFNSSRFLCCSMPSFGVSTTSPKNTSSFNMSPTLAIIFMKRRNRHQRKNNIRYKGNTNNTSVIIFFKSKTPSDVTLLGRASEEIFVMLIVVLHFIFDLHFVAVSSFHLWSSVLYLHFIFGLHFIVVCHLSFFFIHIFFSTSSLTLPWAITGFFTPHFILSAQFIAECFATLSFSTIPLPSCRERYGLEWAFLPTGVFYLTLLHRHFNLRLSRLLWEPAFLPWSLQGFILILETQTRPICLFDSQ